MADEIAPFDDTEDDGVLQPADSLDSDDLTEDVLDTGLTSGDHYLAATRYGTTAEEQRRGESLDQLLAEEEPDVVDDGDDDSGSGDDAWDWAPADQRAGRLVAPDDGAHPDTDDEAFAFDVGIDGAAASAEEAAVHVVGEI